MNTFKVNRDRWATMTIFEQMGNIGSEVERSIKAHEKHDTELFDAALIRTLDLFDATTEVLIAKRSPKTREVLRARNQYLELFYSRDVTPGESSEKLIDYFMQFSLVARADR